MIPPPVCWPQAGRGRQPVSCDVPPATCFAFGETTQVVG